MDKAPTPRALPRIIALSSWLYSCLLRLGPGGFRRNYAAPALQDFRRYCLDTYHARGSFGVLRLWPLLFGEGIAGMFAEYITEFFGRKQPMLPAIRRSMVVTFWAFVLFSVGCVALARIADPFTPFDAIGHFHLEISAAYSLITYSFDISLLVVVLGGLPFLSIALKRASGFGVRGILRLFAIAPNKLLRLFGAALVIAFCFLSYILATEYFFGSSSSSPMPTNGQPVPLLILAFLALLLGIALLIFLLMAITVLFSVAILRTEFGTNMLRFALVPLALLTLVMAVATLAAAFWTLRIWLDAPQFAASGAGLGNGQTAWVIAIIVAMALSTTVTAGSFWRGLQASKIRTA